MKSLVSSTKSELYEQLSNSIQKKFRTKKVSMIPHSELLHVIYSTDKEGFERETKAILARLEEEYPDDDGTGPPIIFVSAGKSELPDDNGNYSQSPGLTSKKLPSI